MCPSTNHRSMTGTMTDQPLRRNQGPWTPSDIEYVGLQSLINERIFCGSSLWLKSKGELCVGQLAWVSWAKLQQSMTPVNRHGFWCFLSITSKSSYEMTSLSFGTQWMHYTVQYWMQHLHWWNAILQFYPPSHRLKNFLCNMCFLSNVKDKK